MNNFSKDLSYASQMILTNQLVKMEDYKQYPYKDIYGNETIGIGRNLSVKGISRDEAIYLLNNDIKESIAELEKNISFYKDLDEARKCVLINMCVNLGIEGLMHFVNMLIFLGRGQYDAAADEMMNSLWAEQLPSRADILSKIMRTGIMS